MISLGRRSALRQARTYLYPRIPATSSSVFARLLSSLTVLEHREGKIQGQSLSSITAARKLGGPITAFIAGSGVKALAEEAAKVDGLEKVIVIENGAYDKVRSYIVRSDLSGLTRLDRDVQGLPESFAPLLVENIKKGGFTHVIAGHSAFGKNLMPRVGALLDSQQISDIIAVEGEDSGSRLSSTVCLGKIDSDTAGVQHLFAQYTPAMQFSHYNPQIQSRSSLSVEQPFRLPRCPVVPPK